MDSFKQLDSRWQLQESPPRLLCQMKFKNFATPLRLIGKIGALAEEQNHHPDIRLGYGYLNIELFSHDKGSITDRDFKLAQSIDKMLSKENYKETL